MASRKRKVRPPTIPSLCHFYLRLSRAILYVLFEFSRTYIIDRLYFVSVACHDPGAEFAVSVVLLNLCHSTQLCRPIKHPEVNTGILNYLLQRVQTSITISTIPYCIYQHDIWVRDLGICFSLVQKG
jgi:hypothetical protein